LQKKQYVGVPSPNPLIVGKTNSREIVLAITYYSYENEKYSKEKKKVQDEVKGNLHPA